MEMIWMMSDGTLVPLSQMSDAHVAGCVRLILCGGLDQTSHTCRFTGFTPGELRRIFETELLRRSQQRS